MPILVTIGPMAEVVAFMTQAKNQKNTASLPVQGIICDRWSEFELVRATGLAHAHAIPTVSIVALWDVFPQVGVDL